MFLRGNVGKHCMKEHRKPCRALALGETPPEPLYLNWEDYITNPDDCIPVKKNGIFEDLCDPQSNYTMVDHAMSALNDEEYEDIPDQKS